MADDSLWVGCTYCGKAVKFCNLGFGGEVYHDLPRYQGPETIASNRYKKLVEFMNEHLHFGSVEEVRVDKLVKQNIILVTEDDLLERGGENTRLRPELFRKDKK